MPRVRINVPSRLHVTLTDMHPASHFAYGGLGFSISNPSAEINAYADGGGQVEISGEALSHKDAIWNLLAHLRERCGRLPSLDISSSIVPHSGFGSKTALLMGVCEAVLISLGVSAEPSRMVTYTGRGGTSGVGVKSYFEGNVVVDYGHPRENDAIFLPSSRKDGLRLTHCNRSVRFPPHWRISVLLPPGRNISGAEEAKFFASYTPIDRLEALEVIALVHHAIVPAIMTERLDILRKAIREVHRIGFKRAELDHQDEAVRITLEQCWYQGLVAGMSSFGPALYCVTDGADVDAHEALKRIADGGRMLYVPPSLLSEGRVLEQVDD